MYGATAEPLRRYCFSGFEHTFHNAHADTAQRICSERDSFAKNRRDITGLFPTVGETALVAVTETICNSKVNENIMRILRICKPIADLKCGAEISFAKLSDRGLNHHSTCEIERQRSAISYEIPHAAK